MKIYVAAFYGDLADKPPLVGLSLNQVLQVMQRRYEWGTVSDSEPGVWVEYITPDPEDDKIEIWEMDTDTNNGKIVAGFWGWHWDKPEGIDDIVMPGNDRTLYELAND